MTVAATVLVAAGGAASYAASSYLRNREGRREAFDIERFSATVILGAVIGAGAALAGVEVTPEFVVGQLAMYAGLAVVIEKLLKAAVDAYRRHNR